MEDDWTRMAISALTAAISGTIEGIGTGLWGSGVNAQLGSASGDDLVLAGTSEYGDPYGDAAGSSAASQSQSQGRMINPLWILFSSMCLMCCSILLSLLAAI